MQKTLRIHLAIPLVAAGLFCFSQTYATTQTVSQANQLTPAQKERVQEALNNMTPQQKAALEKKMEQKWSHMTPEQKQIAREKMQQHWQTMTPEERQAALEKATGSRAS